MEEETYAACGGGWRNGLFGALHAETREGNGNGKVLRELAVGASMFPGVRVGSDAALSARPRFARTLRVSLCAFGAPKAGGTPSPCTPWQEPEVPAPPTLTQNHATRPARPRFARTLRGSLRAFGRTAMGYVRGSAPKTLAGT